MKGITALFVVCALLVIGFGDSFAAKKIGSNAQGQVFERLNEPVTLTEQPLAPDPPARMANASLVPILPGTYTIGAIGATYVNLSDAVLDLNTRGTDSTLIGNVIFEFIDPAYLDTSSSIGPFTGQYGANLVIFRPAAGNVATVKVAGGAAANAFCVRLNNTYNVTFDGSNSGGVDRSLTIEADTAGLAAARNGMVIQKGCENIVIKNCIIKGNRRVGFNGFGVLRIVNTTFAASGGQNNITIQNNHLMRGLDGIQQTAAGTVTGVLDTNLVIVGNTIGGGASTDHLDGINQNGVSMAGNKDLIFDGNDINGVYLLVTGGSTNVTGVNWRDASVNATFRNNRIHNIEIINPLSTARPVGILIGNAAMNSFSTKLTGLFTNNFIYDLHNFGAAAAARAFRGIAYNATAALASQGSTISYIHNTFNIHYGAGEQLAPTGFVFDGNAFGGGVVPDTAIYKNNIASAVCDASFSRQYLMFAPATTGNCNVLAEGNLYYKPDFAGFGQWNSPWNTAAAPAVLGDIVAWRTDTGNDLLSVEGNPQFVSDFDGHINTAVGVVSAADSVGIGGLKVFDFDGAPRDPVSPDAGADEFAVTRFAVDLEATSFDAPLPTQILAASAAFSPQATFTNRGSSSLAAAPSVTCYIYNSVPALVYTSTPVSVTVGGYDNTTQVTFSSVLGGLPAGSYTVYAIATIAGDASIVNDTVASTLAVQASITSGSFPYLEDFEDPSPETAGAGWISAAEVGSPNDWVIAAPTKTQIAAAHSGVKSFVTKATGTYSDLQESYIFAPILDLSLFTDLLLVEFYSNFQTEDTWDGGSLQMSIDGGFNWVRVDSTLGTGGNFNTTSSTAWYNQDVNANHTSDDPFWSGGVGGGVATTGYSSVDAGGYVRSSTVVSGVAGLPDVRFRWHFTSDSNTNGEGWSVDDVSFSAVPPDDIGVSSVGIAGYVGGPVPNRPVLTGKNGETITTQRSTNRPSVKSLGAVVAGSPIDFETITKNFGANAQAAYTVGLNINGTGEDSDVNSDPLDFGDDDTLTMSWAAPTVGIHTADAWTVLAGDASSTNDTASFDFEVLPPEVVYYEGFNSGTWPSPGWDTLDVDGNGVEPGASWQQDVIAIYEGAHSAGGFFGQANGLLIDDWLISPNTGGLLDASYTVDSLSFWVIAIGGTFKDSIEIRVSTVDTDPGNFTTLLEYIEIPDVWTKYTYALPDAAVRHIGYRYLHYDGGLSGGSSNAFSLDDMRITRYAFANNFSVNPTSVSFGTVPVGFSSSSDVRVKNSGNIALNILSASSDNAEFTVSPSGPLAIAGGDSADFTVTFTPVDEGAETANIEFNNDGEASGGVFDTVAVDATGGAALEFVSLTPDSVFSEDPLKVGKSKKPVKRQKGLYPNWSNLLDELNAQGGFAPGTSETDSAGGVLIGSSFMFNAGGAGPLAKWKPVKDSASVYCWVRLAKWDFKKSIGKSFSKIQSTLYKKGIGFHTGPAGGLDSIDLKFKRLTKQLTKLDPKKHNNKLYAELVALKVNIAASAMGKTPAGLGDLIFDVNGNFLDEMSLIDISNTADMMMTFWEGSTQDDFDSLYSAVHNSNLAFVGPLDTLTFETTSIPFPEGKLTVAGVVNLATVPFLKAPPQPFVATRIAALNGAVESPEEFIDDDGEFDVESMPVAAQLLQNYPNPFNPSTTIAFRLKETSKVTITIFNLLGQEVAQLLSGEELEEGAQSVQFAADQLSSGVYFYRIDAQGLEDSALRAIETRKMLLLK